MSAIKAGERSGFGVDLFKARQPLLPRKSLFGKN
jgi:hypothetical protein